MSKQRTARDPLACCTPLGLRPMNAAQAETVAVLLKALAEPTRLRLMSMITAADEVCVCDLAYAFDVSQPTISHHLRVLREAGWVDCERRGTWVYYRSRPAAIEAVGGMFASPVTA